MVECGSDSVLSILPAGTVNDYARALGLPLDMSAAIDSLSGPQKEIKADAIRFNDRHAAYLIALGDFMESFTKVSSKVKNRFGILAYLYAGLRAVFTMKQYRVKIDATGEKVMSDSILTIVSNTSSVGSFARLLPEARVDDHHLHVLNISPSNPKEIVQIVLAALRGRIIDHKNVHYMRTDKLTLDTDRLQVMDIDGDAHKFTSMDIEVVPACVKINVPEGHTE